MIIVLVLHCQYCELQISLIQLSAYFGAESLNCTQLGDDVNNLKRICVDLMELGSECKRRGFMAEFDVSCVST